MRNFFKNRPRWLKAKLTELQTTWPIFEKCSRRLKKSRGADAFPGFVWWVAWAEYPIQI